MTGSSARSASGAHQLRLRLAERPRRLLTVPGCWDGFSALLIEQAGFEAAFLTGGGLSMARFGRPDMGLVTMTEVAETIAVIRDRVELPLIVDGDTGFGNALNMARTVRNFERAGASAIQIEDQGFPKRCGHMAGKTVLPLAEALGKVKAALDARRDMLVIARTDALSVEGLGSALDRADAYREAGADLVFVEGPRSRAEIEAVAARFAHQISLVHNLVEGGVTATEQGSHLEDLGFAVALHPLILLHGFAAAAPAWLAHLAAHRTTVGLPISTLADMNRLTGAAALLADGARYV